MKIKKIVIAPDSFKGTMSSIDVCRIVENAIKEIFPDAETVKVPIADGGEGTVDAFLTAVGGARITKTVKGPLFEETQAFYGILPDGTTAVIEMAAASGLPLAGERKNPLLTTTYGTGELIADALSHGCSRIIIGLGGSATTDGGIGMAAALGVRFLDASGNEIPLTGGGLGSLASIDVSGKNPQLSKCEILAACDVDNPLYGPSGAAPVFGPQKGADPGMVKVLDNNLRRLSDLMIRDLGCDIKDLPGAGAAGGLGAGLVAFAGATLAPGIRIVLDTVHFDALIAGADLIITGEGRIDGQSLRGKVPVGIAERTQLQGIPLIALVGDVGGGIEQVYARGITAVFSINRVAVPMKEAKLRSQSDLADTVKDIMRLLRSM